MFFDLKVKSFSKLNTFVLAALAACMLPSLAQAGSTASLTSVSISPSNVLVTGEAFNLTATVVSGTGSGPTPTGAVSFLDSVSGSLGVTAVGSGGGAADQAVLHVAQALSAGSHTVTVAYQGDGTYASSQTTLLYFVGQDSTTTYFTFPTPGPYSVFQKITLPVTVTADNPGGGSPTGSVTVVDNGVTSVGNTLTTHAGNYSTAVFSAFPVSFTGTNAVEILYSGDTNYDASNYTQFMTVQKLNLASVTISASVASGLHQYGNGFLDFTFGGNTGDSSELTSGTVTFFDGSTSLGSTIVTSSSSFAVLSSNVNTLVGGAHTISACYSGDSNFNGQCVTMSYTVALFPASFNLSISGAGPNYGQPQTFLAYFYSPPVGAPTGTFAFYSNLDGYLGSGAVTGTTPVTFVTSTLSIGTHTITALYSGDTNFQSTTVTGSLSINPFSDVLNRSVTNSGNCTVDEPVSIAAAVTAQYTTTTVMPTGSVSFFDASLGWIGNGALDSTGHTYLLHSFPTAGSHTVTLSYAGDGYYPATGTSGNPLTFTCQKESPVILLTSDFNPADQGNPVVFNADIAAADSAYAGPNPTGPVSFYSAATTALLGASYLQPDGSAQLAISQLPSGVTGLFVGYGGDSYFAGPVTSSAYAQTIIANTPTPTPTITMTPTPTLTPNFPHSGLIQPYLSPNVVDRGQQVCLYLGRQPAGGHWAIYNVAGEMIKTMDFGSSGYQCWTTSGVAAGYYIVHAVVQYPDGTSDTKNFHLVVR